MQIIAGTDTREAFERLYQQLSNEDVILVDLESRYEPSQSRQDVAGLIEALKVIDAGKPVIIFGWQTTLAYSARKEWHAILGHTNTAFIRHPASLEELTSLIQSMKSEPRFADPLAIELLEVETPKNSLQVLHHDMNHALQSDEGRNAWLSRARKGLGEHSDEELIQMVQDRKYSESGPLSGRHFPDVCVDVEGTLIDVEGNIRKDVVQKVKDLSQGRPVTIWTGGDIQVIGKMIRKLGLEWKLASKYSLSGATVYAIIDDLDQGEFAKTYNVDCDVYIKA